MHFPLKKPIMLGMSLEAPRSLGFSPDNPIHHEAAPLKEPTHELTVGAITFSGKSGTGKTTVATALLERLEENTGREIPFIKVGEQIREEVERLSGKPLTGYGERDLEFDRQLDAKQIELIKNATLRNPVLVEGRLSGILTDLERRRNPDISAVTILFVGRKDIRAHRIWEREKKRDPSLKLKEVQQYTKERETKDLVRWKKLHPELQDKDPFNPANKNADGKPAYDLIVNANKMSVQEVTDHIFNWLLENGYLKEKPEEQTETQETEEKVETIPLQGTIFEA